jgi:hypothetical protein
VQTAPELAAALSNARRGDGVLVVSRLDVQHALYANC